MEKSHEELEKEYAETTVKVEQYQHQCQRLENRIRYYTEGERKKQNHRLITRGGAVESIAPEVFHKSPSAVKANCLSLPEKGQHGQSSRQSLPTPLAVRPDR